MEENKKKDLEANELSDDVLEGAAGGVSVYSRDLFDPCNGVKSHLVTDGMLGRKSNDAFLNEALERLRKEGKFKYIN